MTAGVTLQNSLNTRTFRVVIDRTEEDDGYIANIPSLNSCFAFGDTIEEAMTNLQEALQAVLEVMQEYGEPIPDDRHLAETVIQIPLNTNLVTHT